MMFLRKVVLPAEMLPSTQTLTRLAILPKSSTTICQKSAVEWGDAQGAGVEDAVIREEWAALRWLLARLGVLLP